VTTRKLYKKPRKVFKVGSICKGRCRYSVVSGRTGYWKLQCQACGRFYGYLRDHKELEYYRSIMRKDGEILL
jgi:hypothetical protein